MAGDLTLFKKNSINYYGVFCSKFDKINPYNDMLTKVRKQYYESGLKPQKNKFNARDTNGGVYRYNYNLNEDSVLKWRVYNESHFIEKVISKNDEDYRVEIRDRTGKILQKCIYFGTFHNWEKTKYFDEKNKDNPALELVLHEKSGIMVILKYTPEIDLLKPEILYPCTVVSDPMIRQKITDKLGTPDVYALCTDGLVYFADHKTSVLWNKYANEFKNSAISAQQTANEAAPQIEKTAQEPVKPDTAVNNTVAPKMKIDLTQTQDIIIPNVVKPDSVVIHTGIIENSSKSEAAGKPFSIDREAIAAKTQQENDTPTEAKVHSDSLKSYEEIKSEPVYDEEITQSTNTQVTVSEKAPDIFDAPLQDMSELEKDLKSENNGIDLSGLDDFETLENLDELDNLKNSIENHSDDVQHDTQSRDNDSENELEITLDKTYNYKRVRPSYGKKDMFADYSESGSTIKGFDKQKFREPVPLIKENELPVKNTASFVSIDEKTAKKPTEITPAAPNNSFRAARPDKIIRHTDDVYYYYGKLDAEGKRAGYGRTVMSSGHTAYDGEYSDDKRSGFGVYYYRNGKICYAGNWDKNHKSGAGVSFVPKDQSMIIGKWENNKTSGPIAAADRSGNITIAGSYSDGKCEGIGMKFLKNKETFLVSSWDNNTLSSKGTVFNKDGELLYHGELNDERFDGQGISYKNGMVVYSGQWKNNVYNGKGVLHLASGRTVSGDFKAGSINGNAVFTDKNGQIIYEGEWRDNRYHGEGRRFCEESGLWCEGTFCDGLPSGVLYGYDNEGEPVYKGEWKDFRFHGRGILFNNGDMEYEGSFEKGIKEGFGTEYKNNKRVYGGRFSKNKRNGFGISYTPDGAAEYCGAWSDGLYDGIGILYEAGEPKYFGEFQSGKMHGRINEVSGGIIIKECVCKNGEITYMREYSNDGLNLIYEGHVKNGLYDGMGCKFTEYGEKRFEGIFRNGEMFKNMKVRLKELDKLPSADYMKKTCYNEFVDGNSYVIEQEYCGGSYSGMLIDGKPEGKGTILYFDHGYTGAFSHGKPCGVGVIYEWNGDEITGTFVDSPSYNTGTIKFSNDVVYYLVTDGGEN